MIVVYARPKLRSLETIISNLPNVVSRMRKDVRRLGKAGYKHVKTLIPVSTLSKPHLRDSFKVNTEQRNKYEIKLIISTESSYAEYLNSGVSVPDRFPINRKAMVFEVHGKTIFTRRARGFSTRGIHYVEGTEAWLARQAPNYIDFSLKRYLV
jgi:hypothetical protein